ncbi:MAG: nitrate reductase subunit beta [Epsilonproteobacteria bacterium]|nr:MAG: nitrate reductase subunit beta [Campylobacterota bacterium]RLA65625.1 MAG: nitrate reductase subunit beta [Campylobacterota bacterium]
MDIRAQISMVFHLDKCIGCHTCSIACKNVWTDRKGAEYMWWNNVETKPGTGYPHRWEDQEDYKGGWEKKGDKVELKGAGKFRGLKNIFHNPSQPVMDDYYEPWTYKYSDLIDSPEGDDQPTARPVSLITGKHIDLKSGPNWDDDLSGSEIYAKNDPNFSVLDKQEQEDLFKLEKMVMSYLPRICNHCLNPACLASCPSGAIYKRGEDGVVLINQEVCRAWRMCVTSCPYKKSYYNWSSGKSEKCILCYPRIEAGEVPACMHSCVGRIRYLGVLLYDADKLESVVHMDENKLIDGQMDAIVNPHDPEIIEQARKNGIHDSMIEAAQKSPIYKWVKEWGLALPLHAEYRTIPMLFYVPPLLPIMGNVSENIYDNKNETYFTSIDQCRLPIKYLAGLFSAGDEGRIRHVLKKLMAVRIHRRGESVGDIEKEYVAGALKEVGMSPEMGEAIYKLSSLCTFEERFVVPASHREEAIEMTKMVLEQKGEVGFGFSDRPDRVL